MAKILTLAKLLQTQGMGSRKSCIQMVLNGRISMAGQVLNDADLPCDWPEGTIYSIDGEPWQYFAKLTLVLHKPSNIECSRKPSHYPSILSLLPIPFREREIQPIGRLDADTTGILLLTDDGDLNHRLSSPKHHVPKRYEVTTRHPISAELLEMLEKGVSLHQEDGLFQASEIHQTDEHHLFFTIHQGVYHQVKRMIAAAGNRCEALHRHSIGALGLGDLAQGQWRYFQPEEQEQLFSKGEA